MLYRVLDAVLDWSRVFIGFLYVSIESVIAYCCSTGIGRTQYTDLGFQGHNILGGSWDLVSKVISTLIGVISIVTLIITLVTTSHDPLSSEWWLATTQPFLQGDFRHSPLSVTT